MASESDFKKLLLDIIDQLENKTFEDLRYIVREHRNISEEDSLGDTAKEFLECLENKEIISKDNVTYLKTAFKEIKHCRNRNKILCMLCEYESKQQMIHSAKESSMWQELVPNFIETAKCYEVEERFKKENLVVLNGISASGKSQICIWYASKFRKKQTTCKLRCVNEDDLLTSFRDFLEFSKMKFERRTETKGDYIKHMAEVAMSLIESGNKIGKQYLFVFDDVTEMTCKVVEHIIHSFQSAENVKILCSTSYAKFYEQCTDKDVFVKVEGVSPSEALKFFKEQVKMKNSEKDIKDLAIKMGHLPYGLVLANSYIFTTGMPVKKYVEQLSQKEFLETVEKLIRGTSQEYDKGLISAQMLAVNKVEESSSVHVKSLLRFIPFLHHSRIPIRLLRKLLPEIIDNRDKDTVIYDLIANVRKYCIGEIESENHTQAISIHAVTALVLELRLTADEKETAIQDLLCFFCKNISIDCRLHLTLTSNLEYLPHATKITVHAVQIKSSKEQKCVFLLCALHAAIGVSYRVGGIEGLLADEHLNKAKSLCFQLIDEPDPESFMLTKEEIDSLESTGYIGESKKDLFRSDSTFKIFSQLFANQEEITNVKTDRESELEKHYQNARAKDAKVELLYNRLITVSKQLPKDLIADIIIETERTVHDLDHLEKVAELPERLKHVDERKRGRLSEELYEKLLTKKLAMPRDKLGAVCVVEMMIIILYNNGRHHYNQRKSEQQLSLVSCNELRLAYFLGEQLQKNYPEFPSVQRLITERNGILYICLYGSKQTGKSGKENVTAMDKIIHKYEKMLNAKESKYFEYGIIKVSQHQRLHHDAMCLKLLLKCYTKRIANASKKEDRDRHHQKGEEYASKLEELLQDRQMRQWLAVPGFHVQLAKFSVNYEMDRAINHFKLAVKLEEEYNLQRLSHFKLQGQFGLVECYIKGESPSDLEEARKICDMLVSSLHESKCSNNYKKAVKYKETVEGLAMSWRKQETEGAQETSNID
ncbi:uncharacterized protein LOC132552199 [Ylistrum balloti]|uniref:uncharacterized protein LOC132552199 n=1 Tax=Ylistrum balloti TaxID=509963 RepID=UPI002905BF9B|nr:uncharacterized protein LOC132552199 [Ylistrum balloti]